MRKMKVSYAALLVMIAFTMLVAACAPAATVAPTSVPATAVPATAVPPTAEPTKVPPTAEPTKVPPTAEPTKPAATAVPPTPTAPPPAKCEKMANPPTVKAGELGSAEKPLTITFVPSGDTGKITKAGTAIAECLSKMTGLAIKIEVGTSFTASIEAMGAEKAQIGFLNTTSAILGAMKYGIQPAVLALRKYSTNAVDPDKADSGKLLPYYKGQFVASKASGITKFADLKGKNFCFVDPTSASGNILPRVVLAGAGINPDKDLKVAFAGSHPNVAIAVYKGDCDAGVTFIDVMTDAAANLKEKYPDISEKVVAFADTARIPNDGMQFIKSLPQVIKDAIVDSLLNISKDPGGAAMLISLYNYNALQKVDATVYDDFTKMLKDSGFDLAAMVK